MENVNVLFFNLAFYKQASLFTNWQKFTNRLWHIHICNYYWLFFWLFLIIFFRFFPNISDFPFLLFFPFFFFSTFENFFYYPIVFQYYFYASTGLTFKSCYLKNANLTVYYITGTYFFSQWPEFTIQDIVQYVLKLWRAWAGWRNQKNLNVFGFPTSYGYT